MSWSIVWRHGCETSGRRPVRVGGVKRRRRFVHGRRRSTRVPLQPARRGRERGARSRGGRRARRHRPSRPRAGGAELREEACDSGVAPSRVATLAHRAQSVTARPKPAFRTRFDPVIERVLHVLGRHLAPVHGGLVVELHAASELERIHGAVLRHRPTLGQARHDRKVRRVRLLRAVREPHELAVGEADLGVGQKADVKCGLRLGASRSAIEGHRRAWAAGPRRGIPEREPSG